MSAITQITGQGYLFPNQAGNSGKYLTTNGAVLSWGTPSGGGGGVTSVGLSSSTSGVTIGGTPITTSGTLTIAIATASGSSNGLLSSTDWTTFNNKASSVAGGYLALSGGTLTGALGGTSGLFSSNMTATSFIPSGSSIPTNGMYLSAANTLNFATNSTNQITITSGGNVAIGTYGEFIDYKLQAMGSIGALDGGFYSDSNSSVVSSFYGIGQVLTGSNQNPVFYLTTTWNTSASVNAIYFNVVNTSSGSLSKVMNLQVDSNIAFAVTKAGEINTGVPSGFSTISDWKLGQPNTGVIIPNRYLVVEINGQIYSIPALLGLP
jgi:hypothetical protein